MTELRDLEDSQAFDRFMEKINEQLAKENVPVRLRAFKAIPPFCDELKCEITIGDNLDKRITEWFRTRYPDEAF